MGWKVFERELNRVGKSIGDEGKRLADRTTDELARFAEKQLMIKNEKDKAAAAAAAAVAAAAEAAATAAAAASAVIEEIKNPNGLEPGRAYIINTLSFNDTSLTRRTGSEADVERLRKIFRKFGMKVKIASDATLADVRAMMKKISLFDFNSSSCLVIVIMSHGSKRNIIEAKDGQYCLDLDVIAPIVKNKTLTSKLKFIAVEACKGPVNPLLHIEGQHSSLAEIPIEILQINSCVEGYVSYLDQQKGSLFITALCEHLEKSGQNEGILDIVSAVVLDVKQNYSDIQIPMVHTNFTKKFVFGHYAPSEHDIDVNAIDENLSDDENLTESNELISI